MFDIGWTELLLIAVVAIVVIGPKDLPRAMRTVGQWTTKMKRMAGDFQRQFNEAVREAELDDVKNQVTKLGKIDPMADLKKSLTKVDTDLKADLKKVDDSIAGSLAKPDAVNPVPKTPPRRARRRRCAGCRRRDCRPRGGGHRVGGARCGRRRGGGEAMTAIIPKPPEEDEIEASRAPLMEHLIELRKRLMWAMLAILIAFIVCFFFAEHIYNVLVFPYEWASGPDRDIKLIYTAPQEFLITQIKLAFFGAVFIAFPVIASQVYKFVAPGLYKNERQAFLPYLIATPLLFILGACVVYFGVMPLAMTFFLSMEQAGAPGQASIELLPKVNEYLSLIMMLILAFGFVFQLPVVLTLLARIGVVTSRLAQVVAALRHRLRLRHRRGADPARRDLPAQPRDPDDPPLRGLDPLGEAGRAPPPRSRGRRRRLRRRRSRGVGPERWAFHRLPAYGLPPMRRLLAREEVLAASAASVSQRDGCGFRASRRYEVPPSCHPRESGDPVTTAVLHRDSASFTGCPLSRA